MGDTLRNVEGLGKADKAILAGIQARLKYATRRVPDEKIAEALSFRLSTPPDKSDKPADIVQLFK